VYESILPSNGEQRDFAVCQITAWKAQREK
jgi:hypothetical protein